MQGEAGDAPGPSPPTLPLALSEASVPQGEERIRGQTEHHPALLTPPWDPCPHHPITHLPHSFPDSPDSSHGPPSSALFLFVE